MTKAFAYITSPLQALTLIEARSAGWVPDSFILLSPELNLPEVLLLELMKCGEISTSKPELRHFFKRTNWLILGDAYSRFGQILTLRSRAERLTFLEDGLATVAAISQLHSGQHLIRSGTVARNQRLIAAISHGRIRREYERNNVDWVVHRNYHEQISEIFEHNFQYTKQFAAQVRSESTIIFGSSLVEDSYVKAHDYYEWLERAFDGGEKIVFKPHRREPEFSMQIAQKYGAHIEPKANASELLIAESPGLEKCITLPTTPALTSLAINQKLLLRYADPLPWMTANAPESLRSLYRQAVGVLRTHYPHRISEM